MGAGTGFRASGRPAAALIGGCPLFLALLAAPAGATASDTVFAALVYRPGNAPAGREHREVEWRIETVKRGGAAYAVLPSASDGSRPVALDDPAAAATLARLARRHRVGLAASVAEPTGVENGYRIVSVLWDREGRELFRHTQVMPPAALPVGFVRGQPDEALESADDGQRRLGVLAAADLRAGVPRLAARGAGTILVTSADERTEAPAWRQRCRDLARTHRVNLIVASPSAAHAGIFPVDGSDTATPAGDDAVLGRVPADRPEGRWPRALGLPSVPAPTSYEATAALVELGRQLFFEPRLSRNGRVSCATCHRPEQGFADAQRTGQGVDGRRSRRNVPGLLNVAYRAALQWDGGSVGLEDQAKFPLSHAQEMDLPYLESISLLRQDPAYARRFADVVDEGDTDFDPAARALASYQRTLVSAGSPFDRFHYAGERSALSSAARRGLSLFIGKAGCVRCHTIGPRYALLTDHKFHNTGVGYVGGFPDLGRGALTDGRRSGFFQTPSLRNVALTAPYMHDGSLPTLEDVVAFYDRGGVANPQRDPDLGPLGLTARQRRDLAAFLRSLTGTTAFTADGRARIPSARRDSTMAALDFQPRPGDIRHNRDALARLVTAAARRGASLVVLPEHAQTGPLSGDGGLGANWRRAADESAREAERVFGALARRHRVWLTVPVAQRAGPPGRYALTTLLLDDSGRVAGVSRKQSPRRELGDGAAAGGEEEDLQSIETPFGRIGLLAGDDLLDGVPRLAARGAQIVLVGASWRATDGVEWDVLCRRMARDYRVTLVIGNLAGSGPERTYPAAIVGADGASTAHLDGSGLVLAPLPAGDRRASSPALGIPSVPFPSYRDPLALRIELGRQLFSDPRLSRNGRVSCATCHDPQRAFADGVPVARGVYGRLGTRNTPTLLNAAYRPLMGWDGSATSLEAQVKRALQGWAEMDADESAVVALLEGEPAYATAFQVLNQGRAAELGDVVEAVSDYVRTLVSGDSRYDRYTYRRERSALTPAARRGLALFRGRAGCVSCHTLGSRHALFTDLGRHNTGVGYQSRFEYLGYGGDGLEVNAARNNAFKGEYVTPSLRDVARTAPYMHDGSLETLADVVRFYDRGGVPNPFLDPRIRPLGLRAREQADLVAFLHALDGTAVELPPDRQRDWRPPVLLAAQP